MPGFNLREVNGIRDRLATLRELDPKLRTFGADRHRHQLAPPIDASRLAEIEAGFGAALPDGYRAFVSQLGDGGAGPYWGLHPLATGIERLFDMFDQDTLLAADFPFDEDVDFGALVGMPADWKEHIRRLKEEPAYGQAWDELKDRYHVPANYAGTLPICDFGCGESYFMVVRGAQAGWIWVNAIDNGSGLFSLRIDFLEFYSRWLDDSLARARAGDFRARSVGWSSLEYGDNPRYRRPSP